MKKGMKRGIGLMLAAVMALALPGCGSRESSNLLSNEDAKKYVYASSDLSLDLGENENILACRKIQDRIYFTTCEYFGGEEQGIRVCLVSVKEDGSEQERILLLDEVYPTPGYDIWEEEIYEESVGDEGILQETEDTGETEETEETEETGETDIYRNIYSSGSVITDEAVYFLYQSSAYSYDAEGNYQSLEYSFILSAYEITGQERFTAVLTDDESTYLEGMAVAPDGSIVVNDCNNNCFLVYDREGYPVREIEKTNNNWCMASYVDAAGAFKTITYNDTGNGIGMTVYDLASGKVTETVDLFPSMSSYEVRPGIGYELLLTNNLGVYGYNPGDEEPTPILNYINSDMSANYLENLTEIGDGRFVALERDYNTWEASLCLLTPVAPEDIPDREVISLACNWLDYDMRSRIIEFNKESDKYKIVVVDYSQYNTADDYEAGIKKLNNDIVAGRMPDILIMDTDSMPVDSYVAKGLFLDIGKMIDADPELSRDDYMQNVFEAFSVNGKLYTVIPSFNVRTLAGKTSIVGDRQGWTMEEFNEVMTQHPDANMFEPTYQRDNFLYNVMMFSGSRFVDRETGKCHFDSQDFMDLLELVKTFPAEVDWESFDDNFWRDSEFQYRNNQTILTTMYLYDFSNYKYIQQGLFGDDISLIGFPGDGGNGAVVNAYNQYAISARSANKEGAWEFLRYYLTDEYQETMVYWLPISQKALREKLEAAKERPYWEDEDGNKQYYDNSYWIGDQEITIEPLTDEEADMLFDFVSSVNMPDYSDSDLLNIITEEAEAFFSGQKSVQEVAGIIQSRAQVYINESR